MKKKLSIIFAALSIFVLTGYFVAEYFIVNEVQSEAEHIIFENEEEAIAESDLVLEVRATKESTPIVEEKDPFTGHTLTEVEVLNVLVNNSGENIDSHITIAEPYVKTDHGLGSTFYIYCDYTPLKNEMKYILLLNWGEGIDEYWVNSLEQGKINIDGKDKEEQAKYAVNEQYKELAQSIREKFDK